jgi:hypothetical protein
LRLNLRVWTTAIASALAGVMLVAPGAVGQAVLGGVLPGSPPGALFPVDNWWNIDGSTASLDANSTAYIQFINNCASCCPTGGRRLHPDFGGNVSPGSVQIYGIPYAVVDGNQPKRSVIFFYDGESDGVDQATGQTLEARHYMNYPVVHGRTLPQAASNTLAANPVYRDQILLGIPMVQAHLSEASAPPFGIVVHESARAFASAGSEPLHTVWWKWANNANQPVWDALGQHLREYFQWYADRSVPLGYPADRIKVHREMAPQYIAL